MTLRTVIDRVLHQEDVNFVLTNRIPRRMLTRLVGWFSRVEQPLVRDASIAVFRWFAGDLRLYEARTQRFRSLSDCFTRKLADGARPIAREPGVLVSPCDAIVGAFGRIDRGQLIQAKGMTYTLDELVGDAALAGRYHDGAFVTLRLTASMYHRFHAPADARLRDIHYIPGDTWNVNPPALARVPRLFCRNERAVMPMTLIGSSESIALVPIAAILVASIQFAFLDPVEPRDDGPHRIACEVSFRKGQELGHFRHGSTIVVLATAGLDLVPGLIAGQRIQMGEPLLAHTAREGSMRA